MPTFSYTARDAKSGQQVYNSLEADTESAAIGVLLKRDLLVVSIEETLGKKGKTSGGRVGLKDLVVFTRQLATMIDAGIAVVSCLAGLAKQTKGKIMRDVIDDVRARIESGDSLSDALTKHPKVFNKLYVCMIDAGEKGGMLAEVLTRLATYLENSARLRRKIKSAMMYPTIVTIVAVGITIFLLVKVVPVFKEIFDSFKGKLPGPTMALIDVSEFVQSWIIPILMAMGGAVYGWLYFIKTPQGRAFWDTYRIRLPIFGGIAHSICLSRFANTFSALIRSGVPLLSVMDTVSKACGNVVMERAVNAAIKDIEHGETISSSLAKHAVFPDMIIRMISAGEETGKIDTMLERIAKHLDEEIETVLAGLTSLIEPILIVFLGVVVGGIVICMFLPIFKLSDLVSANH
jgi:type IV pilus assembly protein PilC